jgi:hypothetical protein
MNISNIIQTLLSNFTLTFFVIGLIFSAVAIYKHRTEATKAFIIEVIYKYYCFWALGVCYTYNGIIHIVFHEMAAGFIGWADSPFQIELGVASLGFGIVGLLSLKNDFGLRLGLVVSTSIFLWGCASGHVYQIITTGNMAAGNAGVMLWTGLLQPVISLVLLRLSYVTSKTGYKLAA